MGSEGGVQLKEKKYRLRKYKNCFTGGFFLPFTLVELTFSTFTSKYSITLDLKLIIITNIVDTCLIDGNN